MRITSIPESKALSPTFITVVRLWPYLWPKGLPWAKARFIAASLALVLAKVAVLAVPLLFKAIIDHLSFPPILSLWIPFILITGYTLSRIGGALFSEVRDVVFAYVAQRALRDIGLHVFEHLHNLSLSFHLERQTGGLSQAINRGTKGIENLLQFLTFSILPTLVEVLLVCGVLGVGYGSLFAAITLITMGLYIYFTLKITEWRIQYIRSMNASDNEANTKAIDSLLNFETVKYFCNEAFEAQRFDLSLQSYEKAAIQSKISLSVLNIGQALILSLGLGFVMLLGAQDVAVGHMTVGSFVAINILLIQVYIPLFNLGFAYREVKLALVNLEEMFTLMDVPQDVQDIPEAKPLTFKGGEIIFDNVSFRYRTERPILKYLSFVVPAGKRLAIVGPSGAGKSTIARLLFRFYDATEGTIFIDGQPVTHVTQSSLRQLIGVVPQDTVLFNDTIAYNIAYGNPTAGQADIERAAHLARIHDFIHSLPEGYETRVGERGLKLSGGEKQRVAIARTILKQPSIFLFDEATSALDTRTEREIQENLQDISTSYTTIMIAHRLSTVVGADQILVLQQGGIVERGSHEDLLQQKGFYARMWQQQQEEQTSPSKS